MKALRLVLESFYFAAAALKTNLLRTILSLAGVTVGIFVIITVFTLVDSLEKSVKESFNFIGSDNLYVEKWPWGFSGNYPWWKYINRPQPTYEEYKFLESNLDFCKAITIISFADNVTTKKGSNSCRGNLQGVSYSHKNVYDIPIEKGRYFTELEADNASNVIVLGSKIAENLFKNEDPIKKRISIKGLKYFVVGVIKKEGESFIGNTSNDENMFMPIKSFKKIFFSNSYDGAYTFFAAKAKQEDIGMTELEGELRGLLRQKRTLKPQQEDNFAINRPEALASFFASIFSVLTIAGWVIGSFSILVGGFGIANIMFVSVKERTHIIGIQKSLGAKNYFILCQFLFESIFLSTIGGMTGLFLVYLITFIPIGSLSLQLTIGNALVGILVSSIIGIVSGIIPAFNASRLDPVIAIRTQ
ncbi:MAG: ABC transporter permease [Chitinophagaceae bacterium]|nr:ABC transporter permease [Chitinophagaceae bacterium]